MSRRISLLILLTLLAGQCLAAEPTVDKTSILVKTVKQLFWAGNDKQVWKWTPSIEFRVNGPLAAGTQLYVDYSIQGKPFVSYKCEDIGEINEYGYWNTYGGRAADPLRSKASTYTGYVNFTIKAKNPLENTNKVLYTGKFKVGKFAYPWSKHANYKEAYTYYVDYDWALPITFLTCACKEMNVDWVTPLSSPLMCYMWFKGDEQKHKPPTAYLYLNGKKVGDTQEGGACWEKLNAQSWEHSENSYHFYQFIFSFVLAQMRPGVEQNPRAIKLWENPGQYEIKVLWEGKLARTAKFTVESDGAIVDGGLSAQLNAKCFQPDEKTLSNWTPLFPVKITDNLNIPFTKTAWQTDAYFGNPIKGFTAQ